CTKYKLSDGSITEILPYELVHEKITPVYEEMTGWNRSLAGITEDSMPSELAAYIEFLEQSLGVPVTLISTGPDRTQTVYRQAISA
ncbi:MAG TPA: adenylosuccinate synthetase, partial [Patescibacteria group bacterium]|nr:adenylosuccinate synthetase [Patescibacteria group bacterium]